jgi:hypothetical protein
VGTWWNHMEHIENTQFHTPKKKKKIPIPTPNQRLRSAIASSHWLGRISQFWHMLIMACHNELWGHSKKPKIIIGYCFYDWLLLCYFVICHEENYSIVAPIWISCEDFFKNIIIIIIGNYFVANKANAYIYIYIYISTWVCSSWGWTSYYKINPKKGFYHVHNGILTNGFFFFFFGLPFRWFFNK